MKIQINKNVKILIKFKKYKNIHFFIIIINFDYN